MWLQLWQEDYRAFICYLSLLHSAHAHSTCAFANYTSALSVSNHYCNTWDLCCLLESLKVSWSVFIFLFAYLHGCTSVKITSRHPWLERLQARPLRRLDFSIGVELILPPLLKNWTPLNDGWSSAIASVCERADDFVLLDRIVSRSYRPAISGSAPAAVTN